MNSLQIVVAVIFLTTVIGCNLGNDDGAQTAIKMVQEYTPQPSGSPIVQMLKKKFSQEEWAVTKTSDDLYRVMYRGSASGQAKELVFGVSINKRHVMALNRDALAFTNPM